MKPFSLLFLLLSLNTTQADWWGGIDAGAYSWNPSPKGVVGNSDINVEDELNLNNQTQFVGWLAIEHLDTWYPNIRFEATSIEMAGSSTLVDEKILRRAAFDGPITTELQYNSYDANLYYQAYDNFVTLDLGVALRQFDGYIKISREDGQLSEKATFNSVVPLAYAAVNVDMPLKGWYAGIVANGGGLDRTLLTDITAKLGWKYEFELVNYSHVGAEIGYRQQSIKLHDIDQFNTDFDIAGGFAGINLRWGF